MEELSEILYNRQNAEQKFSNRIGGWAGDDKILKGYGFVYLLSIGKYTKIGMTTQNPMSRLKQINRGASVLMPEEAELVLVMESPYPREIESILHRDFACRHARGEWFRFKDGKQKCELLDRMIELGNHNTPFIFCWGWEKWKPFDDTMQMYDNGAKEDKILVWEMVKFERDWADNHLRIY